MRILYPWNEDSLEKRMLLVFFNQSTPLVCKETEDFTPAALNLTRLSVISTHIGIYGQIVSHTNERCDHFNNLTPWIVKS